MNTPQNQLYYLSDRIRELFDLFKADEDELTLLDHVKKIELQQIDILGDMDKLENVMNLIVNLLGKDEK